MNVVVTGASGFIGRVLTELLASEGHEVTGFIGRSAPPRSSAARHIRVDLGTDQLPAEARDALRNAHVVAHLAAARKDWGLDRAAANRINVSSGATLLRHARNATRFLLVSSLGVHGCTTGAIVDETSPLAPYDSYGASKIAAERAVKETAQDAGIAATIVRPGIIYGPGDTYGMVTNMVRLIAAHRFLYVGNGANRVQLLHVADAAAGVRAALLRPEAAGQTLLLSGCEVTTVTELGESIARRLGAWIPPLGVPEILARAAASVSERFAKLRRSAKEPFLTHSKINLMTRHYVCDTSRASTVLGFRPAVPLERGLDETVAWVAAGGVDRPQ